MPKRFKTYYNEDEDEDVEFTVFIIHGHSKELHKLEKFLKDDLKFNAVILQNDFSGRVILDRFQDAIWEEADCAIALMSPDDRLESGNYRARQNVFYELGYCQGVFHSYYGDDYNFEPVIIIKERSIDFRDVSDLLGLETLQYSDGEIESTFYKLGKYLNRIYDELKEED